VNQAVEITQALSALKRSPKTLLEEGSVEGPCIEAIDAESDSTLRVVVSGSDDLPPGPHQLGKPSFLRGFEELVSEKPRIKVENFPFLTCLGSEQDQ
jgi:hypothetical protein